MKNTLKNFATTLILILAAQTAIATPIAAPLIDIQEKYEYVEDFTSYGTHYTITNNSLLPVAIFAVTNPQYASAWTSRPNWGADVVSRDVWNQGFLIDSTSEWGFSFIALTGHMTDAWRETLWSWEVDPESVVALGSYENAFGSTNPDDFAYVFWEANASGNYIQPGESSGQFIALPPPASEYAAWDKSGNLIYRSSPIPEPATSALIAIALLALSNMRRSRKMTSA